MSPYRLRNHQIGDIGWVTHRHGVLYAQEFGFDQSFEILVAELMAGIVQRFDPVREKSLIAEADTGILGTSFVVRESDITAKLRLVLVEPSARGLGLGRRLIRESIEFARATGYAKMTLWTHDILLAARHLYQQAGFRCVAAEPCHAFGRDLVSETWELGL